jgi:hypothetical protein
VNTPFVLLEIQYLAELFVSGHFKMTRLTFTSNIINGFISFVAICDKY